MSIAVYSAQQQQQLFDLFSAMTDYYAGDPARINHFVKVHAYARQIGLAEQLDADALFLLETAALRTAAASAARNRRRCSCVFLQGLAPLVNRRLHHVRRGRT